MTTPPSLPTLPGLAWSRHKSPKFSTRIASHVSGREVRVALQPYALYEFEAVYNGLYSKSTGGPAAGLDAQSLQSLMGFFLQMQGQANTFLYTDPDDSTITGGAIGAGNGTTQTFVIGRTLGGASEPCSWVTAVTNVYLNGVAQSSSSWLFTAPNSIGFASAPAAGVAITADFTFAFQCRFLDDQMDFEEFMAALWKLDSVKFRSVTANTTPSSNVPFAISYLVVAGGGAPSNYFGSGGGGAGGVLSGSWGPTIGQTYTATVGAGGTGNTYPNAATNGSNSVLSGTGLTTQTAIGGGASNYYVTGASGGSGGGGGSYGTNGGGSSNGGAGTAGQGYAGGSGNGGPGPGGGGGGGGGGGAGANATSGGAGAGGIGTANPIAGSTVGQLVSGTYYVGGGGGGSAAGGSSSNGAGGNGGGGSGVSSGTGTAGTANTGGGGGGGGYEGGTGGNGGSGVIVLSVPTAYYSGTTTGSPTITTSGSNTLITFTSSGTYTA